MTPATRRAVLWLVALAFTLRVGVRLYSGSGDFFVHGYTFFFAMAQNIAAGRGIGFEGEPPTAFRVPLYSVFLAALMWGRPLFLPIVFAQALVGAGTVWCAAQLAGEMFGGLSAVIAAAITAVYPYYAVHDTALQETSLYTLLTVASVLLLRRTRLSGSMWLAACAGVLLGAGVMTRSTLAPFAVFATLWLAVTKPRAALVCAATLTAAVAPWLIRSYRLTGVPTLSTESGMQLWNGNNALTFSHYPEESSDLSKAAAVAALTPDERRELDGLSSNEAAADGWFLGKGLDYIRGHPWQTILNGFRKIGAAFGWLPTPRHGLWGNLAHALSYGPVMLLGLWGMWLRRASWREDMFIYGAFLTFAIVTAVFYAHTSHRVYVDVYWIVFAAGSLEELRRRYFRASLATLIGA